MASWQRVLGELVVDIESEFDRMKYHFTERLGLQDPIKILPYRGIGTQDELYMKGRVLEKKGLQPAAEDDSIWENLVNMYRRFESDEVPFAKVRATFAGQSQVVAADEEGMFEVRLQPAEPLPEEHLWHTVRLELVEPQREGQGPVTAEGQVLVPPENARFGVISDIDDTVLQTDATHLLNMARNVFLGNAHTRLPFPGVAAFYRALFAGDGSSFNPLFYVSSGPWNIYDLLSDFFDLQDIPIGPILFLRNWGISEEELLPTGHRSHKLQAIRQAMETYDHLPFILIGDSGQEDPEIYAEVVDLYPDRIMAIYVRNVSRDLKRPEAIRELAKKVAESGSTLILADDTLPMAEHAVQSGWISPDQLPIIRAAVEEDQAPLSPVEKLLGEEEKPEPPEVVVEGQDAATTKDAVEKGVIETALQEDEQETKEPPTVIVEGDEEKKKP